MATKNCIHCYYTHPLVFDGTCPAAGEITMNWAMRQHYKCWKRVPLMLRLKYLKYKLWHKPIPKASHNRLLKEIFIEDYLQSDPFPKSEIIKE